MKKFKRNYKSKIKRRMEMFDIAFKLYSEGVLSYNEFKDAVCYEKSIIYCFEKEGLKFPG